MEERDDTPSIMVLGEVRKFRSFRERLHRIVAEKGGITEIIVVDETELKTTQGTVYLWFAFY